MLLFLSKPFPATPVLANGVGLFSEGDEEASGPVWTRAPECGDTFIFRPGSWGLPSR